jgi:hypothetical protein
MLSCDNNSIRTGLKIRNLATSQINQPIFLSKSIIAWLLINDLSMLIVREKMMVCM